MKGNILKWQIFEARFLNHKVMGISIGTVKSTRKGADEDNWIPNCRYFVNLCYFILQDFHVAVYHKFCRRAALGPKKCDLGSVLSTLEQNFKHETECSGFGLRLFAVGCFPSELNTCQQGGKYFIFLKI